MEVCLALGPRLAAYLALERAMVDLDDAGDPLGDELRDRMDPIWLQLSAEERFLLSRRVGDASAFAGTVSVVEGARPDEPVATAPRRDLTVRREVRSLFRRAA